MICPVCKEHTHWNCVDIEGDDPLYQCVHCNAQASKRMLRQSLITNGAIDYLSRHLPLEEVEASGLSILAKDALLHVLRCTKITWADVELVLEAVVRLREPDSTELVADTGLPYGTVSRCITVLIAEGRIRQKEDTVDHCWRYRPCSKS